MDITPLIPDGYNGPIKRLTCSICKHMFYITQDDYHRHPEVRFCHECSLILHEELEKTQGVSTVPPPTVREKQLFAPLCYPLMRLFSSFLFPSHARLIGKR
jgi:hypothetical protein